MTLFGLQIKPSRLQYRASREKIVRDSYTPAGLTLADVPKGWDARISSFSQSIHEEKQAQLQAYGIIPGYWVQVRQRSPVVVVQIDHTELALETQLAEEIQVQMIREGEV
jgi:Fe2+ transport system protein FeoA